MFRSSYPDVPVATTTLHGRLLAALAVRPEAPALIDGPTGTVIAAGELAFRARAIASGLARRGFAPGETVALWAPNMPAWAGVSLAAMAAGLTVTPLSPLATDDEAVRQLRASRAAAIVTIPQLAQRAGFLAGLCDARMVFVLGEAQGAVSVLDMLREPVCVPDAPAGPDSIALLPFSSGTTGLPKGVMLTHRSLVTMVDQLNAGMQLSERSVTLAVAPFAHIMGFMVTLALPLAAGGTVVTMPRFEPEQFLDLAERHRVTTIVGPPPLMQFLANDPRVEGRDLGAVDLVVSGGAPLPAVVQQAVADRLPGATVGQGWGMTELSVGATAPSRQHPAVPGSCGRIVPNTVIRVVDPASGRDVAAGERGELLVRGPQVMAGYLDSEAATAAILDAGGWLHTGDVGYVDTDGNVFLVDRIKDLIKVSGYQVAPAELEGVLLSHPAVADAAVVAEPDERHGEVPVAAVVLRDACAMEDIRDWVTERVAPYKQLRRIVAVESLPRTPSGKLLRGQVRV